MAETTNESRDGDGTVKTTPDAAGGDEHRHPSYVKVWAVLLLLLLISISGPMIGVKILTLITAFGVAIVKAYLVAKNFMHLDIERRYVVYLLATAIAFMLILYAGVAPDVMEHRGRNWKNVAAQHEVERALEAAESGSSTH